MYLYHGGLWSGATLDDVDVFRVLSDRRQEGDSQYAGFYLADDIDVAEGYAGMNDGVVFGVELDPGCRVHEYQGDITGVELDDLKRLAREYDLIYGENEYGVTEYVLLNKDVVLSFNEEKMDDGNRAASAVAWRIAMDVA